MEAVHDPDILGMRYRSQAILKNEVWRIGLRRSKMPSLLGKRKGTIMTEQEKNDIINELEAKLEKKYKGCVAKEDTQTVLKEPRNKWFRDTQGSGSNSKMTDAFDSSIIAWQVWETIRKLTCVICGKQYVRHLENADHADKIAEELCQFVYDLRMRQKEEK